MPVFFTVVTIFDGSIFTSFRWLRALAGDVTVDPAVVAYCAVRTVARYVTLTEEDLGLGLDVFSAINCQRMGKKERT